MSYHLLVKRLAGLAAVGTLLLAGCSGQTTDSPTEEQPQQSGSSHDSGASTTAVLPDDVAAVPGQDAADYQPLSDPAAWLLPGYSEGVADPITLPEGAGAVLGLDLEQQLVVVQIDHNFESSVAAFDIRTGAQAWQLATPNGGCAGKVGAVEQVACFQRGAGGDGDPVFLVDTATGKRTDLDRVPFDATPAVVESRDGSTLLNVAGGAGDDELWLVEDGEIKWRAASLEECRAVGDYIGCGGWVSEGGQLRIIDAADGSLRHEMTGDFGITWATDGFLVGRYDGDAEVTELYDLDGTLVTSWAGDVRPFSQAVPMPEIYYSLEEFQLEHDVRMNTSQLVDANGKVVTANLSDGRQGFLASGEAIKLEPLGISADGQVVLGSADNSAVLLDAAGAVLHDLNVSGLDVQVVGGLIIKPAMSGPLVIYPPVGA